MTIKINQAIVDLEKEHDITFIHVSENGSRAWKYHHDRSDYDVKGIYVHNDSNYYLNLFDKPDFIEKTVDIDVSFSCWDINKFLRLVSKGNAQTYEIIKASPSYLTYDKCGLLPFTEKKCFSNLRELAFHYYGLARRTYQQKVVNTGETTVKKYLYMIRPLLHIEQIYHKKELPELNFHKLLNGMYYSLPKHIHNDISEILEQKQKGILDNSVKSNYSHLDNFISDKITTWSELLKDFHPFNKFDDREEYETLYRNIIQSYGRILHQHPPIR